MEKIIQITAGRGPAECCWVVAKVLKLLLQEAREKNIYTEVIHREEGVENATLFSAVIQLRSERVDDFLTSWLGTIQWIGQSKFRKFHKRKNWFVGVSELDREENNPGLKESDVKYEFIRSGGPGGQHVNKVSTAVRATHIPSGIVTFSSKSRSQLQNKKQALRKLDVLLQFRAGERLKKQVKDGWNNHNQLIRGNPVRVFSGSDFRPNHQSKKYKRSDGKRTFLKELRE